MCYSFLFLGLPGGPGGFLPVVTPTRGQAPAATWRSREWPAGIYTRTLHGSPYGALATPGPGRAPDGLRYPGRRNGPRSGAPRRAPPTAELAPSVETAGVWVASPSQRVGPCRLSDRLSLRARCGPRRAARWQRCPCRPLPAGPHPRRERGSGRLGRGGKEAGATPRRGGECVWMEWPTPLRDLVRTRRRDSEDPPPRAPVRDTSAFATARARAQGALVNIVARAWQTRNRDNPAPTQGAPACRPGT